MVASLKSRAAALAGSPSTLLTLLLHLPAPSPRLQCACGAWPLPTPAAVLRPMKLLRSLRRSCPRGRSRRTASGRRSSSGAETAAGLGLTWDDVQAPLRSSSACFWLTSLVLPLSAACCLVRCVPPSPAPSSACPLCTPSSWRKQVRIARAAVACPPVAACVLLAPAHAIPASPASLSSVPPPVPHRRTSALLSAALLALHPGAAMYPAVNKHLARRAVLSTEASCVWSPSCSYVPRAR